MADSNNDGGGCILVPMAAIMVMVLVGALAVGYDLQGAALLGVQASVGLCCVLPSAIIGLILVFALALWVVAIIDGGW